MNKRGHWILGLLVSVFFIIALGFFKLNIISFSFSSILLMTGVILVYSIFPDIDHESGTITWWFIGIATFGVVFGVFELIFQKSFVNPVLLLSFSALLLVITFVATNFLEHRGIIHSIPAGILFSFPVLFLFHDFFYFFLAYINWHSHLIGDGYLLKFK